MYLYINDIDGHIVRAQLLSECSVI